MTLKGLNAKEGRQGGVGEGVRITGRKKKKGIRCTQGIQKPDERLGRCDPDHESSERGGNISRIKSSGRRGEGSSAASLTLPPIKETNHSETRPNPNRIK